jgi:hypothetical protein
MLFWFIYVLDPYEMIFAAILVSLLRQYPIDYYYYTKALLYASANS